MKKLHQPTFIPLVLALLLGLVVSLIPMTPALGSNVSVCQGSSAASSSLKLGGRTITPSLILQASGGLPCPGGESSLNLVSLARTLIVSSSGTAIQNGTALLTAMTLISNSNPSASNPWLLKLEPGQYDLGNGSLTLLPYVDLEGSGEDITFISSTVVAGTPVSGALVAASHSQARFLSIANTGTGSNAYQIAVFIPNSATQTSFFHLNLVASASGSISYGLYNNGGTATVQASIFLASGNATSAGLYNNAGTITVQDSTLSALGTSASSTLYGFDNHNGTLTILNSTLNALAGVNSNSDYGLNNNGMAMVQNSNITASGNAANGNIGIANGQTGSGTITLMVQSSVITASGGTNTFGLISDHNASATIQNSTLSASSGAGSNFSIYQLSGSIKVGTSELSGTIGGIVTCIASYKGDFTALSSACN